MSEGAFVCFGFFYKWQADSNQNSEDTPRSGAVWGSVKSIRGRCWEWGLQGARCCSQQAPGSSDSSVSTPSCAGRAPRQMCACQPLERPLLPGGEAGREMLLGRHGEGRGCCWDMRLEASSWEEALHPKWAPCGRDCGWGTDTSEGQWPWTAHAGAVLAWWFVFFFLSSNESGDQKLVSAGNELSKNLTSRDRFACNS